MHALLGFYTACEVTLRQVGQFVGQYRGVFAFGLRVEKQSAVDPDNPTRRGKGVELRAVDQNEFQAPILDLACLHQLVNTGFNVVFELWIVKLRDLTT